MVVFIGLLMVCERGCAGQPDYDGYRVLPVPAIDSSQINVNTFLKDFKQRYRDAEFIYEFKAPEKKCLGPFKEWLADIFRNFFNFTNDEDSMHAVEIVLKSIAVLMVVFVIYLIAKALLNKEGRWIFGKSSDAKIIRYDDIENNLHHRILRSSSQPRSNRATKGCDPLLLFVAAPKDDRPAVD
jgi:hypothetical protein